MKAIEESSQSSCTEVMSWRDELHLESANRHDRHESLRILCSLLVLIVNSHSVFCKFASRLFALEHSHKTSLV